MLRSRTLTSWCADHPVRPQLRHAIIAACLCVWLASGCEGNCAPSAPPPPEEPSEEHETEETTRKLAASVKECAEGTRSIQELIARADSLRENLAAQATIFEEQKILSSIPFEALTGDAKTQIRTALENLGISSPRVQPEYHEVREKSSLPKYYRDPPPYPYVPAELEEVIHVQVDIPTSNTERLTQALDALRNSEPRLFHLKSARRHDDVVRLQVEMFRFRKVSPPVQSFDPPSLEKIYRENELPSTGPDCATNTECDSLLSELTGLIAEIKPLGAKAELSLRLEAEADLWKARRALFDQRVKEVRDLSPKKLLSEAGLTQPAP